MFKRRTSKVRHRRQVIELQASVVSPRIFWFGVVKRLRSCVRFVVMLVLAAAAVWGAREGLRAGLWENERFRLRAVELSPNTAVDERRLVQIAGIDLSGTLFSCDPEEIADTLRALPEVASANVRRDYPGTLVVDVTVRQPYVWIAREDATGDPRDPKNGLLVDRSGRAFPCPAGLREETLLLPVMVFSDAAPFPAAGEMLAHPEFERLSRLLATASKELPAAGRWIDTLRQSKEWALEIVSRDGTRAVFGLGDHDRQMRDLRAALEHARSQQQQIATIELIPERNLPVLVHGGDVPRAIIIEEPAAPAPTGRERDLQNLLNR